MDRTEAWDTDRIGRALLSYRNTPSKELGLSPAQMLYGRNLRDHLPCIGTAYVQRKDWIMLKEDREKALAHRYGQIEEKLRKHCRQLDELQEGDAVQIQNQNGNQPLRWNKSGVVIERLGHDQYTIRMDGSGRMTLRNRRYLRKIKPLFQRVVTYEENSRHEEPRSEVPSPEESTMTENSLRRSERVRTRVDRYQS